MSNFDLRKFLAENRVEETENQSHDFGKGIKFGDSVDANILLNAIGEDIKLNHPSRDKELTYEEAIEMVNEYTELVGADRDSHEFLTNIAQYRDLKETSEDEEDIYSDEAEYYGEEEGKANPISMRERRAVKEGNYNSDEDVNTDMAIGNILNIIEENDLDTEEVVEAITLEFGPKNESRKGKATLKEEEEDENGFFHFNFKGTAELIEFIRDNDIDPSEALEAIGQEYGINFEFGAGNGRG